MRYTLTLFICLCIFQEAFSLETLPPIASCISSQRLELNEDGELTIYPEDLDGGSFCPIGELTLDMAFNPGDHYPFEDSFMDSLVITPQLVSRELSLVFRVTDPLGNSDYCFANIYVKPYSEDDTPPVAICHDYLEFELIDSTSFTLRAENIDNGSFDTEGAVNIKIDIPAYETFFLESSSFREEFILDSRYTNQELSVVLMVIDEAENVSFCTTVIYIHDTANDIIPPIPLCTELQLKTSSEYGATLYATDIDRGSYDETSPSLDLSITRKLADTIPILDAFSQSIQIQPDEIGSQIEIILRTEDRNENVAYCNSMVDIVGLETNMIELVFIDTTVYLQDTMICIPFLINNFKDCVSLQWEFTWDTTLLAFHSLQLLDNSRLNFTSQNYNASGNQFFVSWFDSELLGLTLDNGTFAEFCFQNKASSPAQTTLLFSNSSLEIVNSNTELVPVFARSGVITILNDPEEGNATSITDIEKSSIHLHPNPTSDYLHISSEEVIQSATISDIHGKPIKNFIHPKQSLNVQELASGIYFIQILTSEGIQTKRFIVQ